MESYQEFLDQETVVDDDDIVRRQRSGLLIGKIGVVDRGEASLIAVLEYASQLLSRHRCASGNDQTRHRDR